MRSPARPHLLPCLGLAVLFGLAWCQAPAAPAADSSGATDSSRDPGGPAAATAIPGIGLRPAPIFASLERAWVVGNADSVLEHFGKRKVYISLPDGGPDGGVFSRAQSYFILKDFFDATRTEEFSFVSIRQLEDPPGTAVGRAERIFRKRDSSRLLQDRLFVSLVQEDDHWVVAEIKSVR